MVVVAMPATPASTLVRFPLLIHDGETGYTASAACGGIVPFPIGCDWLDKASFPYQRINQCVSR
jgi:hypothetical protein